MSQPEDSSEGTKPRRSTGRIITSGSAGRVAQTPSHQVDEIPFIPAFDLLESASTGTLKEHEVTLIAATLWAETAPSVNQSASRWTNAARILAVSQRL